MKHKFNLVLSADYQMGKLVPTGANLRNQALPTTYKNLNHDIFGIVNHATGSFAVYIFDERVGPKTTDNTVRTWRITLALFQPGCIESTCFSITRLAQTKLLPNGLGYGVGPTMKGWLPANLPLDRWSYKIQSRPSLR